MKTIKDNKRNLKENRVKKRSVFLLLVVLIATISMSYIINETDFLLPKINESTASYISFNNLNATDMLKISNVQKMKDRIGRSNLNHHYATFEVIGKEQDEFNIELYSLGNKIDKKYIKYTLLNDNKIISSGTLEKCVLKEDGAIILYQSKINKNNSYRLKIWISKEYKEKAHNISYEIKIKSR